MRANDFWRDLGIAHPIIQGPMAGGRTAPALVAAVCNAGALGSLGAGYLRPDQIASDNRNNPVSAGGLIRHLVAEIKQALPESA